MIGEKYGRLTVIEWNQKTKKYICKCECGEKHEATKGNLKRGNVRSCGCIARERCKSGVIRRTHGMAHTRLDTVYKTMVSRCYNENNKRYKHYGERGIKVCDEWLNDKEKFFIWAKGNGYSEKLTLDRKDCDGNYTPENCRWATYKQQANNKRNNRIISINGQKKTLTEWAETVGTKMGTIWSRLNNGWDEEKAIMTKPRTIKKKKETEGMLT